MGRRAGLMRETVGGFRQQFAHGGDYTRDGKRFKSVENHVGWNDQSPMLVTIPAGNYDVHALSDFGPVIAPVLIRPGKTTSVNLDSATARPRASFVSCFTIRVGISG